MSPQVAEKGLASLATLGVLSPRQDESAGAGNSPRTKVDGTE